MIEKSKREILEEFDKKRYDNDYDFERLKLELLLDMRDVIYDSDYKTNWSKK